MWPVPTVQENLASRPCFHAFLQIDLDGDGTISKPELNTLLTKLNGQLSDRKVFVLPL